MAGQPLKFKTVEELQDKIDNEEFSSQTKEIKQLKEENEKLNNQIKVLERVIVNMNIMLYE